MAAPALTPQITPNREKDESKH